MRSLASIAQRKAHDATPGRKERQRDSHRQRLYGLSRQGYDDMLAAQGGRCAICHASTPGGRGDWHVDHDHVSGDNRGLLCHFCNVGLGNFSDDPARLRAAADYLEGAK